MQTCEIKCEGCDYIHSYDCSNLKWKCVNSSERDMGTEYKYQAVIEDTCSCNKLMVVKFNCWEYPEGTEETKEVETQGATMVKNNCPPCPDLS